MCCSESMVDVVGMVMSQDSKHSLPPRFMLVKMTWAKVDMMTARPLDMLEGGWPVA